MDVLGMETGIGKRPSGLTSNCLTEFNEIFCKTIEYLGKSEAIEFASNYWGNEENEILDHGYWTLSKIFNWLGYYQLLVVTKTKRPNPQEEGRNQTVWSVKVHEALGAGAYERGAELPVDYGSKELKIGVGRPYAYFADLWNGVRARAEGVVAKSRWERWEYEFRNHWIGNFMALKAEEAVKATDAWVGEKISQSPKLKRGYSPSMRRPPGGSKGLWTFMEAPKATTA